MKNFRAEHKIKKLYIHLRNVRECSIYGNHSQESNNNVKPGNIMEF